MKKWVYPAMTVGLAAQGYRIRQRIAALPVLSPTDAELAPEHRFIPRAGVKINQATARAASAYAVEHELDALDLVPADLSTDRLLSLLNIVDPRSYRDDPMAIGKGAAHAVLVTADLAERAGLDRFSELDPMAFLKLMVKIKRHAARSTDLVVAPGVHAVPDRPRDRNAELRTQFADAAPAVGIAQAGRVGLAVAGAASRKPWGVAAAVSYCAQPLIATVGTVVRPRDLLTRSVFRLPTAAIEQVRALRGPSGKLVQREEIDQRRKRYREAVADGLDHLFDDRREQCPICESTDLTEVMRTPDALQGKPGEFVLDQCGACDTIFQNPRLSLEGLDYYYGDFYDGVGEEGTEVIFNSGRGSYEGRVEMVARHVEPQRWLDVGTGHGHFPLIAKGRWPGTTFDGLDLSDSVEEAERRQWIATGYRGLFPDLADELADRYDVVSMHHYLEHVREPIDELEAIATVLVPGGHALIEVPDPESRLREKLGRFWGPYFQPQHQTFLTGDRLGRLLEERGFTVVDVERGEAHQPVDFTFSTYLALNTLAPDPDVPWREAPTFAGRARRQAVFAAGGAVIAGAFATDFLSQGWFREHSSNTYRLLARWDGPRG